MPVEIRTADSADAEAISTLLDASFVEFKHLYTPQAYRSSTPTSDEVRARLTEGTIWTAHLQGTIVGTVSVLPAGDELFVRSLAVHPTARGRGVAKSLLRVVESLATAQRFRRLTLTTTPFLLDAIGLYERAGFHLSGEESAPHGTRLLTMRKDLA